MANLDTTALAAVLKQQYTQSKVYDLCYKNNPLWSMIKKKTNFVGSNKVVAVRNATPQGRSHTFATAQANITASKYNKFTVTRASGYSLAEITGEAILASKGDAGALLEGLKKEIDGAIFTEMRNIAIELYRNGGAARGVVSSGSTVASTSITLATVADITNFEVGMVLKASAADGTSGAVRTGTVAVTGIDRDAGTLTAAANWSTGISAIATGDYLFQEGDFGSGLSGLAAWVPASAPSATTFFGLDRTQDVVRLGGIRYSGSGAPIEETLIEAAARCAREGGNPDAVFMNPLDYSNLIKALGSKVVYDRATAVDKPEVGFQAVTLVGPMGPMKVIGDVNCPKGTAFMLQLDTWSFESLGAAPQILDLDDMPILRKSSSDSYEVRVGWYGNLVCEAPGYNVNITL